MSSTRDRPGLSDSSPRPSTGTHRGATVLLAEDESLLRDCLSSILENDGYRVVAVDRAKEALALLDKVQPDIMVSDVMMPGMDGFALCRRVRADVRWSRLPFIFLTVRDQQVDMREAMQCGADDYLTKPFKAEELLAAVRGALDHTLRAHRAAGMAIRELRDALMRTVGHEFRTPLTYLLCYADLLEDRLNRKGDQAAIQLLDSLRSGALQLSSLVEDFLLLAFLQSRQDLGPVSPAADRIAFADAAVSRVAARFDAAAAAKSVRLTLRLGAPETLVSIDEPNLAQIVSRLIDNAIKFSRPEGGEVILASRLDVGLWCLEVADDGAGIPPDVLPWLFEPFGQVDRVRTEQEGAGMGLPIVDATVRLHGGQMSVESRLGLGSTFTVRLPLAGQDQRNRHDD